MNKIPLMFLVGVVITVCVLLSSCAHVRRPCISGAMPVKKKITTIRKPSPFPWQEEGVEKLGMDIVVDPDSMLGFFQYVGELEDIAEKAGKCVER